MDKSKLLREVEMLEARRLFDLSQEELVNEMIDWFNEDIPMTASRIKLTNDYMEDFMGYRQDDSVEELREKIKNIKSWTKNK